MPNKSFTVHSFSKKNFRRQLDDFEDCVEWGADEYALAAAGPVGFIGHLLTRAKMGDALNHSEVFEEIADAVVYLDLLCTSLGGSLDQVIAKKFNATSEEVDSGITLPYRAD